MKVLFALALLASTITSFAGDLRVGKWTGVFIVQNTFIGGANFSITGSGKVTGKGIYFNGAITRISGSVQEDGSVQITETAPGFRRELEGKPNGAGDELELTYKKLSLFTKALKPSESFAGTYRGRDSAGHLAFGVVSPSKGVSLVLLTDHGNIELVGKLRGGKNFNLTSRSLFGVGGIRNGRFEGLYGPGGGVAPTSFSCEKP